MKSTLDYSYQDKAIEKIAIYKLDGSISFSNFPEVKNIEVNEGTVRCSQVKKKNKQSIYLLVPDGSDVLCSVSSYKKMSPFYYSTTLKYAE